MVLPSKYVGPNHEFGWYAALPHWTLLDRRACYYGFHRYSRKLVVRAWIQYNTTVNRYYCACGSRCWIWYDDGFTIGVDKTEPNAHISWIESAKESFTSEQAFGALQTKAD